MDLFIISVQNIKPSLTIYDHKPFKLSLLDQLAPAMYPPMIFFYPLQNCHSIDTTHILNNLKKSLSKTLDLYYPLSGRFKDNLCISDYNEGVPFTEVRVKGRMSDFLQDVELELLNQFLPYEPFCLFTDPSLPQLVIQANVFDCGGMALGVSLSHKIFDGATTSFFLRSWAANTSGSYSKVIQPNLFEASLVYPPLEPPPQKYMSLENLCSMEERPIVRRFVFDANAIATLIAKSKSDVVENPSRVQALLAFIWKSKMAAYRRVHDSQKPSILFQAKDIRRATKPRFSKHAIGNLFWAATTRVVENDMELSDLVVIMKEGLKNVNSDFLKPTNILKLLKGSVGYYGNLDVFISSSWNTFGLDDVDFGWGKPVWVGVCGKTSETRPSPPNFTVLKNVRGNKTAMEAWVALDEQIMAVLENDTEFLTFASPSCHIS